MDDTVSHKWDFLAPQFVDFSKPVDDSFEAGNPEEYFDFDHENNIPLDMEDNKNTNTGTTTEAQVPLSSSGSDDTQNIEEESKPSRDTTTASNSAHETESSDDGMTATPRINKPLFHLSSSCDSQEETEPRDESSSIDLHSVVPPPPVFSDEDIPAPPKTTEQEDSQSDTSTMETEDSSTETSAAEATAGEAPDSSAEASAAEATTGEAPDSSAEASAAEATAGEAPDSSAEASAAEATTAEAPDSSLEASAAEATAAEAPDSSAEASAAEPPVFTLPAFHPRTMVIDASPERQASVVKQASPVAESVPTETPVDKPYRSVDLETSWATRGSLQKQEKPVPQNVPTDDLVDKSFRHPNVMTSWGKHSEAKTSVSKPTPQITRTTQKRRGSESQVDNHRLTRSMSKPRRSLRLKPRRSNAIDTSISVPVQTPSSKRRRTDLNITAKPKPSGPPKLTMPQTPTFMKRKMHFPGEKAKKTEDMELDKINELQKQMAKTRKLAEESYRKLQVSTDYVPVRSQQPITQPKEFEFRTDTRITRTSPAVPNTVSDKDFFSTLRKHTQPQKQPKGPTKPQPFNFSNQHKSNHDEDHSIPKRFKSMAEQVAAFQVRTPERFQTSKRRQQNKGPVQPVVALKLTCPKTPALETRKRKRPSTAVSARDKEDKEVEDMKSYKFKANPVNPRVMSNINIGVKVANHKEPTKPIGFSFHTDKRVQEREADNSKEEEEKVEFHARPVPAKILQGVTGLPDVKPNPLTCPKSPAFALKNRKKLQELETKPEEEKAVIKARPAPHAGIPFVPNLEHKITEAKPFSFASRDEATASKKEEKIQQMFREEQKMREFKAQLMPILDTVSGIPEKKLKKATETKPFGFCHEDVGAKRADDWSKKMAEELEAERNQTFHAREANVLYRKPFKPQKSDKPLTEVSDFMLNSDKRAEQRQQYDMQKKFREHELTVEKSELDRQNAIREQKEIAHMRAARVHKSNPVRHYKVVEIERSEKPLTQPVTPNFSDRFRNRTIL